MDCGFAVCQEGEEFPGQLPVIKNEVVEEELDEEKSETSANVESDESLGGDWDMQIFDAGEMIRGKDIYVSGCSLGAQFSLLKSCVRCLIMRMSLTN